MIRDGVFMSDQNNVNPLTAEPSLSSYAIAAEASSSSAPAPAPSGSSESRPTIAQRLELAGFPRYVIVIKQT